jgi:hypothetical protein
MRVTFDSRCQSHRSAVRCLEALCEGYVQAMMTEISEAPPETYPCCIKCGGFSTRTSERIPCEYDSLGDVVTEPVPENPDPHGIDPGEGPDLIRKQIAEKLGPVRPGRYVYPRLRVRSARAILESGGGNSVELACYQTAQKRLEGADPFARVVIVSTVPGCFRGVCLMSHDHKKPERRGMIDDPVEDARPLGGCQCVTG